VCDDGERVAATVGLVGIAVLSMLHRLEQAKLLTPVSAIKNLPFILSLILKAAEALEDVMDYGDEMPIQIKQGETWPDSVVAYAKHHGIELSDTTGVSGTSALVEKFNDMEYDEFPAAKNKKSVDDRWGFKDLYKKFVTLYGPWKTKSIGGNHFDITKIPKRDRIGASYEGMDPLVEMGPPPPGVWKFGR
jgi:hypothetical protein